MDSSHIGDLPFENDKRVGLTPIRGRFCFSFLCKLQNAKWLHEARLAFSSSANCEIQVNCEIQLGEEEAKFIYNSVVKGAILRPQTVSEALASLRKDAYEDFDLDYIKVADIIAFIKKHGYFNYSNIWYKFEDEDFTDVSTFQNDKDIQRIFNTLQMKNYKVLQLFVEHAVDDEPAVLLATTQSTEPLLFTLLTLKNTRKKIKGEARLEYGDSGELVSLDSSFDDGTIRKQQVLMDYNVDVSKHQTDTVKRKAKKHVEESHAQQFYNLWGCKKRFISACGINDVAKIATSVRTHRLHKTTQYGKLDKGIVFTSSMREKVEKFSSRLAYVIAASQEGGGCFIGLTDCVEKENVRSWAREVFLLAEIWAVYLGLSLAWEKKLTSIDLKVDLAMTVRLIKSGVDMSHPLFPLISDIRSMINNNWDVIILCNASILGKVIFDTQPSVCNLPMQDDLRGICLSRRVVI
ncbi:reverse transcriptase [Senna tora]|uniref:Reverse transcriptase n=1 Tax=Senna tora TaxID=362788 RepID=A0A835C8C4_9FABA|nr:reverse transcriptase [Senna tora]